MIKFLLLLACVAVCTRASGVVAYGNFPGDDDYTDYPTLVQFDNEDWLTLVGFDFRTTHEVFDILEQVKLRKLSKTTLSPLENLNDDKTIDVKLDCLESASYHNLNHVVPGNDGHFAFICATGHDEDHYGLTLYTFKDDGKTSNFTFGNFNDTFQGEPLEIIYHDGHFYVFYFVTHVGKKVNTGKLFIQGFKASNPQETTYAPVDITTLTFPDAIKVTITKSEKPDTIDFFWSTGDTLVEFNLKTGIILGKVVGKPLPESYDLGRVVVIDQVSYVLFLIENDVGYHPSLALYRGTDI